MSRDFALAHYNQAFLDGDAGRPIRILAEYLQPLRAFQRERIQDTIVFFGSARLREHGRGEAPASSSGSRGSSDRGQSNRVDCRRRTSRARRFPLHPYRGPGAMLTVPI